MLEEREKLHDAFKADLQNPQGMATPFTVTKTKEKLIRISDKFYSKVNPWHTNLESYRNPGNPLEALGEKISPSNPGTNQNRLKYLKTSLGKEYFVPSHRVTVERKYPVKWLSNDYQSQIASRQYLNHARIDLEFFKKSYMNSKWADTACDSSELLPHQQFVEYCCRPFSPVRRLLVHARTGSGKTRMMTAILDNFSGYPNRKLILLPTRELRTAFCKTLHKHSVNFFAGARSTGLEADPKPEIVTHKNKRQSEMPDKIHTYFSKEALQSTDIITKSKKVSFEQYIDKIDTDGDMSMDTYPLGATLILTFEEFGRILNHTGNKKELRLVDHFLSDEHKDLTLNDATVLVDEAHLLLNPKWKLIREFLEKEQSDMYSMYLFSATPGLHDRYRNLLWIGNSSVGNHSIQRNCVSRYEIMHEKLYNQEKYKFKHVKPSEWLKTRSTKIPGVMTGTYSAGEKWMATSMMFVKIPRFRSYLEKKLTNDNSYIIETDEIRYCDVDKVYSILVGNTITEGQVKNYSVPAVIDSLFPIGASVLKDVLIRYERRSQLSALIDKLQSGSDTLENDEKAILPKYVLDAYSKREKVNQNDYLNGCVETLQKTVKEWRFVIMVDVEYGIVEMSKLLQKYNVPHILHGMEASWKFLKLADMEQTYHLDTETTAQLVKKGTKPGTDESYYRDSDLLDIFNAPDVDIPVLLSNSYSAEGFSVFRATNLFIMNGDTMNQDQLEQAYGRINRMCNQTTVRKDITVYTIDGKTCPPRSRNKNTYLDSGLYDDASKDTYGCDNETHHDHATRSKFKDGPYDDSLDLS
tara:strand:- start:686 stop:3106 length:2421 start_codon:yes stop_codon:yes gene_type:complete